ncbi:copper chaperone PCu(A)C [Vibrio sp. SM6]|uniref:Copper chaperone PCu(A)C n=1 Tax=Vibrio agarilyticus TaxID=2726741 RepID=A0A7X8TPY9_9VIBR|nr:copper chaperone PCu(A)C [Vibrio agarilyticus]NLS12496.1 copper chaperone PCu(A)C [Vibrio agarilyticus]
MRTPPYILSSLLAATALMSVGAHAQLDVSQCVIREPAPGATATALYLNLDYTVTEAVKGLRLPSPEGIVGAKLAALSDRVELHTVIEKDGVMTMQQITRLRVDEGRTTLKPGGYHLMLTKLKRSIKAGETYPVTLMMTYQADPVCEAIVMTSAQIAALQEAK